MSKRVFQHPPERVGGRKYWRSLGQLADTPEFRQWLEREFPQGASELAGSEISRRSFLQLMGASAALAGLSLTACRRPEKHLVPFTRGVEWSIPGKALFFATARPTRRGYAPLVATTHDGRPTKIDGNPLHPASKGASDTFSQASLLDLYDRMGARIHPSRGKFAGRNRRLETPEDLKKRSMSGSRKPGTVPLAFLLERNPLRRASDCGRRARRNFLRALGVYEPREGADGRVPPPAFAATHSGCAAHNAE